LQGKQAGIYSVNVDGTGLKTLKTFDYDQNQPNNGVYFGSVLYQPNEIYYEVNDKGAVSYLKNQNGNLTSDNGIKDAYAKFISQPYPTYLLSPSGKQTYWVEPRDGKSSLLLGDDNGNNSKEIAKLDSKFNNYGYYTDDYLLASKDNDEIYVMSAAGVKAEADLIKITDYHKPAYNFYGYGGGYGGL
jgi:hypothetical protein